MICLYMLFSGKENFLMFQCNCIIFMISNYLLYSQSCWKYYMTNNLRSWIRCCHIEMLSNSFPVRSLCRIKRDQHKFTQEFIILSWCWKYLPWQFTSGFILERIQVNLQTIRRSWLVWHRRGHWSRLHIEHAGEKWLLHNCIMTLTVLHYVT